jgi:hypothetical protein
MDIQQKLDMIIESQKKIQEDIHQMKMMMLRYPCNNIESSPLNNNYGDNISEYFDSDTESEDGVKVSPNLLEACRNTDIKYLNTNEKGQSLAWAPPKEPGLHNSKPILNSEMKNK